MDWLFFIIFGASVVLGTVCTVWFGSRGAHNPYDVERLRRDMLDQATTDEERAYLEELDALELHRRHLVC